MNYRSMFLCLTVLAATTSAIHAEPLHQPVAIYLTWQADPSTSMTVQWISRTADHRTDLVQYRPVGGNRWFEQTGAHHAMPGSEDHLIHHTRLDHLEPGADYEVRCGVDGASYRFRTMPQRLTRPIRFAVGGDVYRNKQWFGRICDQLAARDLDFIVLGGDIAGGAGKLKHAPLWIEFLSQWAQHTTTKDGRLIPMIPVMGNHEVANGGFHRAPEDAPFFNALFAYPGLPAYGVLDFGDYMSLLTLNSGHIHEVDGEQKQWLDKTLAERAERMHTFAAYHVPAWPAARPYSLGSSREIRETWIPIFEKYKLDAAFEHHEHCFKRTQPIRDGEIHEQGVIYFGNGGCSETEGRIPAPPGDWLTGGRWYLAKSGRRNHFHMVTLDGPVRSHQAIDVTGHVFDEVHVLDKAPKPIVAPPTIFKAKQVLLWGAFAGASGVITLAILAWIFWEIYKRVRKPKPA